MASKSSGTELRSSFHSEPEAHAFARLFTDRTGCDAKVSRLEVNGTITDWLRVTVPTRLAARAEDLRAAWDARSQHERDEYEAQRNTLSPALEEIPTIKAEFDATTERLRTGHVAVVGLTDAQRSFLEDAAEGDASPWAHPSNAVAFCKRLGFVQGVKKARATKYEITEQGRAALYAEVPGMTRGATG